MNRYVTLLLLLLFPFLLNAQDWFSKHELNDRVQGFIIGIAGDTIYGFIEYSYPIKMQKHISFYDKNNNSAKEYTPDDIRGFGFDGKHWMSTTVTMKTYNGPYNFKRFGMLHIMGGAISIYRVYDEMDKQKKKINSEEADKTFDKIPLNFPVDKADYLYIKKMNEPGELISWNEFKKDFIGKMKVYIGDDDALYQKVLNKGLKIEHIDQIVIEYNKWFDANFKRN